VERCRFPGCLESRLYSPYGLASITGSTYYEVEAYNIQTAISRDLGILNLYSNAADLRYMLSLGLPSPFGLGVSRDYCQLCKAREALIKLIPDYEWFPLISELIPVTTRV
jgi:hypothetical protein